MTRAVRQNEYEHNYNHNHTKKKSINIMEKEENIGIYILRRLCTSKLYIYIYKCITLIHGFYVGRNLVYLVKVYSYMTQLQNERKRERAREKRMMNYQDSSIILVLMNRSSSLKFY